MQYSIAREIFGKPWQISALGIQQYQPVVTGMLNGAEIVVEKEPKENLPYAISANTSQPMAWSEEEENSAPEEESQKEKVVHVLPVRGVMMKHDMMCGPRGARTLGNRLRKADTDESVIGHVVIIEGPGGSAAAVPELSEAIQECKKPVVVFVDGLMCSAHMYVGSYADNIIASREDDLIGCIGTLIVFQGRTSKSEEDLFKVREVTIYADEANEKNEEYEKAINEFDFKLTKDHILNPHNKKFTDDIKKNRPNVEDKHLHGRTFPALEVVGTLIDSIGSFDTAVDKVIELANFKKVQNQAQGSSSQAANNNQIKTEMKQYKNVNAALGVEQLEAVDGAVSLNEEQLGALESSLAQDPNAELQGQLDTANTTLGERDTTITDLTGQVETANSTIAQRDQTIADLQDEVADLKGEAAVTTQKVVKNTDGGNSGEVQAITEKYDDPLTAIDAISEEYLGKSINQ